MRVYFVEAATADGSVIEVGTSDTASRALAMLLQARQDYIRAWVTGDRGDDLLEAELHERAVEERGTSEWRE